MTITARPRWSLGRGKPLVPSGWQATPWVFLSVTRHRSGPVWQGAATSQAEIAGAVAAAREQGHTWSQIATMLGTSRLAGQERSSEAIKRP